MKVDSAIVPDVWGRGLIFAFSGMDGETSWAEPFVLSGEEVLVFKMKGPGDARSRVRFVLDGNNNDVIFDAVTGDFIHAATKKGARLALAWHDRNTLAGSFATESETAVIEAQLEGVWTVQDARYCQISSEPASFHLTADGGAIAATPREGAMHLRIETAPGITSRFALSLGKAVDPDRLDAEAIAEMRAEFVDSIPRPALEGLEPSADVGLIRMYRKCVTVMKVNCMSPESQIKCGWTTPDRVPHRHMWIWDSAFHAEGLKYINAEWAENAILAVFMKQREDGFIPHTMTPDGSLDSDRIQPPVLGWSALNVYRVTGNKRFLKSVYEPNARFLDWITNNMDGDGNGLTEWKKGGTESGMDNSPRFEFGEPFDSLDLNCFVANDLMIASEIGRILGDRNADVYEQRSKALSEKIRGWLWDPERKFFFDRKPDGTWIHVKTPCAFLPMWAGIATKEQADALVAALLDPKQFWTPMPVPCVALDDPTYEKDMWRGPSWVNYNYFTVHGLTRYGYVAEARELARRNIREVERRYKSDGVIYEFYDAEAEVSPCMLNRKGGRGGHWLHTVIPDYNFTASLIVALMNGDLGIRNDE